MMDLRALARSPALTRTVAVLIKEFVQLRRDRVTFGTMIFIPVSKILRIYTGVWLPPMSRFSSATTSATPCTG